MSGCYQQFKLSSVGMLWTVAHEIVHHLRSTELVSINVVPMRRINIYCVVYYNVFILRLYYNVYLIITCVAPGINFEKS